MNIDARRDRKVIAVTAIMACCLCLCLCTPAWAIGRVALIPDASLPPSARHGLAKLEQALKARDVSVESIDSPRNARADFLLLAGLSNGGGPAITALKPLEISLPDGPEAFVIQRTRVEGKPAIVLCATDARGLMYAALDVAKRVSWSDAAADLFEHVADVREKPYIRERAVSMYTMQRAYFESRLYDETYWRQYFDMLAESRINSFVVIFGYENGGFMAPPYPYFFDVDQFSDVQLVGITPEQQRRNVAAFRKMIQLAHDRGIDFVPAIWDHIYRGGVQGGGIAGASELSGQKVPGLVWGVTSENLAPYTKAAIQKFLQVFPDIDGIQFRMHGESGLKPEEMEGFWHEIFVMLKQTRPDLRVDLRAKDLPDAIIADALDQGLKARVATKYWMEQMGMPFHPTHINLQNQHDRRHGYADLLRYPQRYKVHWRLWNGGTTRLLLWGDPDYVRIFAKSARLYDGDSLEVNEMLATKMLGEPHDARPLAILNGRHRYYDYEFERYWHFYQVWGLVSYNPETGGEVWERDFAQRFGGEAGKHLMQGLHLASQVLPRIVAASYRYQLFPTTRGWPEMMRIGDLEDYAGAQGSDIQQFLNVSDHARSLIEGSDTAMRRPEETSRWFAATARRILEHVARAEKSAGAERHNEFVSTVTDLRILASLAKYHSARLQAGVAYNLYRQTGDLFAFDDALRSETQAVSAWEELVAAADDVYSHDLAFGVHRVGFPRHWNEELGALRQGLARLRAERRQVRRPWSGTAAPRIHHVPVRRVGPGDPLVIRATVAFDSVPREVRVLVAEDGADCRPVTMRQVEPGMYSADVPPSGKEGRIRYMIQAVGQGGDRSVYRADVTVAADPEPPIVHIEAADQAQPGQPYRVIAKVIEPSGVKCVRLRYRHLTQFEDYQTAGMKLGQNTGHYQAEIPGDFILPGWDLMYFVEVFDNQGNGRMYPDLESGIPYVIVPLER